MLKFQVPSTKSQTDFKSQFHKSLVLQFCFRNWQFGDRDLFVICDLLKLRPLISNLLVKQQQRAVPAALDGAD